MNSARRWLSSFSIGRDADIIGFDHLFYKRRYIDLKHIKGRRNLVRHYRRYGKNEGRFSSLADERAFFKARGRIIPADFNVKIYRTLNVDLQKLFTFDWEYELHFLEFGSQEGRPYGQGFSHGWKALLDPYDFEKMSRTWRSTDLTEARDCIKLFEDEGIARLAPLARTLDFDPNFYKNNYSLKLSTAEDLYRHWIDVGITLGYAPNEKKAIEHLVAGGMYPSCFDWRIYSDTRSDSRTYPAKTLALQHLFEDPTSAKSYRAINMNEAHELYQDIGLFHMSRGSYPVAAVMFDKATFNQSSLSRMYHMKGDAYRLSDRQELSIQNYYKALACPNSSVWTIIHLVELLAKKSHAEAYKILSSSHPKWNGNADFRACIDNYIDVRFRQISDATYSLLKLWRRVEADDLVEAELADLVNQIATLKISQKVRVNSVEPRIVMLACLDLPQCNHYRVDQKIEYLKVFNITLEVIDFNHPEKFMQVLPGAMAAFFYRVPAYPKIIEAILYASSLSIPTYYDIDDLIFTNDFPDTLSSYGDFIKVGEYLGLLQGVTLYRQAIKLCDFGIASTSILATRLEKLVVRNKAFVVANGLDHTNDGLIETYPYKKERTNEIKIFYGTGTKAHHEDFIALVAPALFKILKNNHQVHLIIVGYLSIPDDFKQFGDRVISNPIISSLSEYWFLLATCDINIAVLKKGIVEDCKSEIKWLEAAVVGVPSIVSSTATYVEVLTGGLDVLFASTSDEWFEGLQHLVESTDFRRKIGAAAREKAISCYNKSSIGRSLFNVLSGVSNEITCVGENMPVSTDSRIKVLICNVFFNPQTHGGATRVVENNVDYIISNYGSSIEVSVFCTDDKMQVGQFRVVNYRGCKVYKVATPQEARMDWRPFNTDNLEIYDSILKLATPDIVHFHCIQRLTATIVEATLSAGIPYIVTLHDGWWISDFQFLVDDVGKPVSLEQSAAIRPRPSNISIGQSAEREVRLRRLLCSAALVLPVSESFAELHRTLGISNIEVVANGVPPLPPRLFPRTPSNKLVLGHIGGRSVHKGANLLEIALREGSYANLELLMIDGRLEAGEVIRTRWGCSEVLICGQVAQGSVNELFASFDVLVAPSIWPESFGLVTREALFYGKWIVTSNLGAIGDDIVEGENGFVIDVSNTKELCRILAHLDKDLTRFKSMPVPTQKLRTSDDQAVDITRIYKGLLQAV